MSDSRGRWWEIQPDEGGPRELVTDSRGRSRPERSLSAGADLADEPRHRAHVFLWPVVSAAAAVVLIVSVIYVTQGKSAPPASATPPQPAARGSVENDVRVTPDARDPAVPSGRPLAVGRGALAPVDDSAGISAGRPANQRDSVGIPQAPAGAASSPARVPSDSSGNAARDTGDQHAGMPPSSATVAAAPVQAVMVKDPAPAAPGAQPAGQSVSESGRGSCRRISTTGSYSCVIVETARIYIPGTTDVDPRGPLPAGRYRFLCQSSGSRYSVGNRTSHWWAWVGSSDDGAWVPVVFLSGASDDMPMSGLPKCGSTSTASTSTTTTPSTTAPSTNGSTTEPVEITIVDHKTERCLGSNDQNEVRTLGCDSGNGQKWESPGDGTIRDKRTKRCLGNNDEGKVYTLECNDGGYQKWYGSRDGTIRNRQTGRCLDSNEEGKVYTSECNGGDYQKWNIK